MRKPPKPVEWMPVSVEHEGHLVTGRYAVDGGRTPYVTVEYAGRPRTARASPSVAGHDGALSIARMLLRELIREHVAQAPPKP